MDRILEKGAISEGSKLRQEGFRLSRSLNIQSHHHFSQAAVRSMSCDQTTTHTNTDEVFSPTAHAAAMSPRGWAGLLLRRNKKKHLMGLVNMPLRYTGVMGKLLNKSRYLVITEINKNRF